MKPQLTQDVIDSLRLQIYQKLHVSPRLFYLSHYDMNIPPALATQLIQLQRGIYQPYYAYSSYASLKDEYKIETQQFYNSFAKAMLALQKRAVISPKSYQIYYKSPGRELMTQNERRGADLPDDANVALPARQDSGAAENGNQRVSFKQRIMLARQSLVGNKPVISDLQHLALQTSSYALDATATDQESLAQSAISITELQRPAEKSAWYAPDGPSRDVAQLQEELAQKEAQLAKTSDTLVQKSEELEKMSKTAAELARRVEALESEASGRQRYIEESDAKMVYLLQQHFNYEQESLYQTEALSEARAEAEAKLQALASENERLRNQVLQRDNATAAEDESTQKLYYAVQQIQQLKRLNIDLVSENSVLKAQAAPELDDQSAQLREKDELIQLLQRQLENKEKSAAKSAAQAASSQMLALQQEIDTAKTQNEALSEYLARARTQLTDNTSRLSRQEKEAYEAEIQQRNDIIRSIEQKVAALQHEKDEDAATAQIDADRFYISLQQLYIKLNAAQAREEERSYELAALKIENEGLRARKVISVDAGINCTIVDSHFPEMLYAQKAEGEQLKGLLAQTTRQNSQLLTRLEDEAARTRELEQQIYLKNQSLQDMAQQIARHAREMQQERQGQIIRPPLQNAVNYVKQAVFQVQSLYIVTFSYNLYFLIQQVRDLAAYNAGKAWTYLFEIELRSKLVRIPFDFQFKRVGNLRFKQFVSDDDATGTEVFKLFLYIIIQHSETIGQEVKRFPSVKFSSGDTWAGVE